MFGVNELASTKTDILRYFTLYTDLNIKLRFAQGVDKMCFFLQNTLNVLTITWIVKIKINILNLYHI